MKQPEHTPPADSSTDEHNVSTAVQSSALKPSDGDSAPALDAAQVLTIQVARNKRCEGSVAGMRILLAVDSRFPGLGGAESQALKLAFALRERGAMVEFVTPRVLASQSLSEEFHGFKINRIDYPHIRWLGSLVLMARFSHYLIKHAFRFDAVHIHITHLLAAAAGFSRDRCGLPITTKISGFYEFEGGVLDPRYRFKPLNFLIRQGLKHVDNVQTISQQTREKLLASGFRESQIRFVPNGIDTRTEPHKAPNSTPLRIGYCGRLREVKGVHILLDAFAILKSQLSSASIHLVIAGSGDMQEALMQQAETLGIADNIDWLGLIDDTSGFFQSIDIYVQPSFAEGLPNSVMEAMVEQRPVIATNVGGNADLVETGNTGLLFPVGDADALAAMLSRLVNDSSLREQLAIAGRRQLVLEYGFDSVVGKLSDLYRGL